MKQFIPSLLLALASLAGAQSESPSLALHAQPYLGDFHGRTDLYDGLMVATALGPPVGHPFPNDPYFAVQPFRVDDSRAFARGAVVSVYFETVGLRMVRRPQAGVSIDPSGSVPAGGR